MKIIMTSLALLIGSLFSADMLAQDDAQPNADPSRKADDAVLDAASRWQGNVRNRLELQIVPQIDQGNFRNVQLELVPWLRPLPFASDDSQYAAENAEEIQTYQDLQMSFKYIEEPYLRKQLRLADEEGLIVLEARPSGEGFRNGFRDGDLILEVDDTSVDTQYDFVIALTQERGEQRKAEIRRDGEPLELTVVMSEPQAKQDERYFIGVSVEELSDLVKAQLSIEGGVGLSTLGDDSAAAQAGLVIHDVIVQANDTAINSMDDLRQVVENSKGHSIRLDVIRKGERMTKDVQPQKISGADNLPDNNLNIDARIFRDLPLNGALEPRTVRLRTLVQDPSITPEHQEEPKDSASEILSKLSELEAKLDVLTELLKKK